MARSIFAFLLLALALVSTSAFAPQPAFKTAGMLHMLRWKL